MIFQSISEAYQTCDIEASDLSPFDDFPDRDKPESKKRTPFGIRLVQSRKAAGLTQQQLAKKAGILQSTLSMSENIHHGSLQVAQLAKALHVNAHWLETGEGLRDPGVVPALDLTGYVRSTMSQQAKVIGGMIDMIQDDKMRAIATSDAMQAIALHLRPFAAPATLEQTPIAPAKKQHK